MPCVAAVQSSYVPWKGYFDLIDSCDVFVLYDDVPYSRGSWRNRNCVKSPRGRQWLTIPVRTGGRFGQWVSAVEVADRGWADRHWKTIEALYASASYFEELAPRLRRLYEQAAGLAKLSEINHLFIEAICRWLGITTPLRCHGDFPSTARRSERLLELCRTLGADVYLSGPTARAYLDVDLFAASGVAVRWMDYDGYPVYRQQFCPPFEHQVSILDLLLNEGIEGGRRLMRRSSQVDLA
jgi:WbqC-like protein family